MKTYDLKFWHDLPEEGIPEHTYGIFAETDAGAKWLTCQDPNTWDDGVQSGGIIIEKELFDKLLDKAKGDGLAVLLDSDGRVEGA
jgi:hypothetical protein